VPNLGLALIVIASSAVLCHLLTPAVIRLAGALEAFAKPGGRHIHLIATPRLGGVAVGLGVFFGCGIGWLLSLGRMSVPLPTRQSLCLFTAVGTILLVGAVDDMVGVSRWERALVEVIASILVVAAGWQFSAISLPWGAVLELGAFGPVCTVLWIVAVTNAINLLDGMDGLATGVIAIVAASMLAFGLLRHDVLALLVFSAILGSCLGFLRHNLEPAKIFLGDSGSLSLGFLLAATSVASSMKASAAMAILVPVVALGIPLVDTLLVMTVRFLERPKRRFVERILRVFRADRNHLHHRLEEIAPQRTVVVRVIYGMVLISCLAAFFVAITQNGTVAWATLLVEALAIMGIRGMGARRRLRQQADLARQAIWAQVIRASAARAQPSRGWIPGGVHSPAPALVPAVPKSWRP